MSSLIPQSFDEFIGQDTIVNNLKIYIESAKQRNAVLDHVLFYGDSGLGKTTLARLIATSFQTSFKIINAASVDSIAQLASVFASIEAGDVVLIDEIHQLNPRCEEFLYPVLQDYRLDFLIQYSTTSKLVNLQLPPFTAVGATTAISQCSKPLRERFGIQFALKPYTKASIKKIIVHHAQIMNMQIDDDAMDILAQVSRYVPRKLNGHLNRLHDYQIVWANDHIDQRFMMDYLKANDLNAYGLDRLDISILSVLANASRPMGALALATSCGIDINQLVKFQEPYLLQSQWIQYTHSGRTITDQGKKVLENVSI